MCNDFHNDFLEKSLWKSLSLALIKHEAGTHQGAILFWILHDSTVAKLRVWPTILNLYANLRLENPLPSINFDTTTEQTYTSVFVKHDSKLKETNESRKVMNYDQRLSTLSLEYLSVHLSQIHWHNTIQYNNTAKHPL